MPHLVIFERNIEKMSDIKKKRGDRTDGIWLKDIPAMNAFMAYLYPNRTDNEAYINERIDLENINRYLEKKNAELAQASPDGNVDDPYKLFHILLAAIVKTISLRPKMNRFIKGYRIYQRRDLSVAFVVKKQFSDEGKEALAFVKFDENTTLDTVKERIYQEIHDRRGGKPDGSTSGMEFLVKLPRFLLRFIVWILNKLDFHGRLPKGLITNDPNQATCFLTNLGSIGLKSGYHHLSNWGTNSLFVIIGEKKMSPIYDADGNMKMKETLDIGLTLDERIADGYYYSKTVKLLKYLLQNPELLELPAGEEVDYEARK